jgi:tetratricopeptide (TPR) repeat protein
MNRFAIVLFTFLPAWPLPGSESDADTAEAVQAAQALELSERLDRADAGEVVADNPPEELAERVHGPEGRKSWEAVGPLEKAAFFHSEKEFAQAERLYIRVLESNAAAADKRKALIERARVSADSGVVAKAVDTLESCLGLYPETGKQPEILFSLGTYYRDLGLREESIAHFYRVLNSIVVTGEQNLEKYLGLARLAQFEIARSHYEQEAYERALMLFERIELLELDPADRETVSYYQALASLKAGQRQKGLERVRQFVATFPESEFVPEMLFLEADTLYRMGRADASADALLELLKAVGTPDSEVPEEWDFWRRQAGNQLANRFYADGRFLVALRLYQGMVALDKSPSWRLPIIYQIGLCFEKLSMFERSRQSYRYIEEQLAGLTPEERNGTLAHLDAGVSWRLEVLDWREELGEHFSKRILEDPMTTPAGETET